MRSVASDTLRMDKTVLVFVKQRYLGRNTVLGETDLVAAGAPPPKSMILAAVWPPARLNPSTTDLDS